MVYGLWYRLHIGYIEVQGRYEELEKLSLSKTTPDSYCCHNKKIKCFGSGWITLIFSTITLVWQIRAILKPPHYPFRNTKKEIVTVASSDYTGVRILLAQDRQVLLNPLNYQDNYGNSCYHYSGISFLYVFYSHGILPDLFYALREKWSHILKTCHKVNLPNKQ